MKQKLSDIITVFKALFPFGILLLFLTSCVRDELLPCPPLQVEISVKDKNYFNVKHVEGLEMPKLEGLPFNEYIPTLYYRLCDAKSGNCICEKELFYVTSTDTVYQITFPEELPHGKYRLTVWGGLKTMDVLSENRDEIFFHPNNTEGEDVYMTSDILEYSPYSSDFKVDMERTKGKLLVDVEHLSVPVNRIVENLSGYSAKVNADFQYSGNITVDKGQNVVPSEKIVVKTFLSPSSREITPRLQLHYFDKDSTDLERLNQKNLEVPVYRNKLTALKLIYDKNGACTILILIDDSWTNIHDMIVD